MKLRRKESPRDPMIQPRVARHELPGAPAHLRYFETMPCGPMEKETITSWSITNRTR
jgi:hypothetical protein